MIYAPGMPSPGIVKFILSQSPSGYEELRSLVVKAYPDASERDIRTVEHVRTQLHKEDSDLRARLTRHPEHQALIETALARNEAFRKAMRKGHR